MVKYSFVIPSYNRKNLLSHTLEALNCQTGFGPEDYEVIVIDDGSDDNTKEYISSLDSNYKLKYVYLERSVDSCRSKARNMGIKVADGEFVVFIDSDIIVQKNHLFEIDRCFRMSKDIVVIGNRLKLPKGVLINIDNVFDLYGFNKKKVALHDITYYIHNLLSYNMAAFRVPGYMVSSCNCAIPKKYLEATCGFDENFIAWGHEDCDLGYRLQLFKDLKFVINSKLEVLHQYHLPKNGNDRDAVESKNYFINKHKFSKDNLSMDDLSKIWYVSKFSKDSYIGKYCVKDKSGSQKIVLDFKEEGLLSQFKNKIEALSNEEGKSIVINDYVENTDLDIWVQLLGIRNSTPRYFPVSRIISNIPHPATL